MQHCTRFGAYFCIIASENQGKIHYAMPIREMMYDALDYTEQVRKIEEAHSTNGDKMKGAEFLSHFAKEDRLMPVVTLTLYYGEPWDGPTSLYDMLGIDEEWEELDLVRKCLPDYRINLIDVKNGAEVEKYRSSLQYVFGMVKYNKNKRELYEYTRNHREEINHMDRDSKAAALVLLGEQKRLLKILENKKEEEMDVCQAIDELIADGERRGEKRGKKRGEKHGEKRGEQKGIEKTKISFIRKQFDRCMTASQTARILDLDEAYVEEVMKLLKEYPNDTDDKIVLLLQS